MFYKVVSADNIAKLTRLAEDLLHQDRILDGGIAFNGASYVQAITRS